MASRQPAETQPQTLRMKRVSALLTASICLLLSVGVLLLFSPPQFNALLVATLHAARRPTTSATSDPFGSTTPSPYPSSTPLPGVLPTPVGSISCEPEPSAPNDYQNCVYNGPNDTGLIFYLFIPQGYSLQKSYPLVLMLHGAGEHAYPQLSPEENRYDILSQEYVAVWGLGYQDDGLSVQNHWPCFVVVPQLVGYDRFVNIPARSGSYTLPTQPAEGLVLSLIITQLVQQMYRNIDPTRRYITGISMGAYGVWDALERWPGYFAAAVPVAGAGDPSQAGVLVSTAIWDFHSDNDPDTPLSGSLDMLRAISAKGGHPCFTLVDAPGHDIWPQVYGLRFKSSAPLYSWLFAQKLGTSPASPSCPVYQG